MHSKARILIWQGAQGSDLNLKMVLNVWYGMEEWYGKNIYLCVVNYRKTFDMMYHELLWKGMLEMGFSSHIVDLIKSLYIDQNATVRTTHGPTVNFRTVKGVQQVCILSPHLLNIYSEYIMRNALEGFEGTLKIGGRSITNLRLTDDIVNRR